MAALNNYALTGQRALVRVDMNVPMRQGRVVDDQRIRASLDTVRAIANAGGAAIILSHLGRPEEGRADAAFSLRPVAKRLQRLLGRAVHFAEDYLNGLTPADGEVVMCENVRFNQGEKSNDDQLARALAGLGELFVMDAFACAHRAHASTCGVIAHARQACAGPLLEHEISVLDAVMKEWRRPVAAIIGGAKISSKFQTLTAMAGKVDDLILGGGIANTMLASQGCPSGRSLVEESWFAAARELCRQAERGGARLHTPVDVICADNPQADSGVCRPADGVQEHEMILDIGPASVERLGQCLSEAKTIVWSGPLGVFENPAFANGTREIARAVAAANARSVAGGGDTLAAIAQFGVARGISHISTGGGAFLHFIEGRELPALAALRARQRERRAL